LNKKYKLAIAIVFDHFSELSRDTILRLSLPVLDQILATQTLRVPSEQYVIDILKDISGIDEGNLILLKNVQLSRVSPESVRSLLEHISVENLPAEVWEAAKKDIFLKLFFQEIITHSMFKQSHPLLQIENQFLH
jgi:hypothetical protein